MNDATASIVFGTAAVASRPLYLTHFQDGVNLRLRSFDATMDVVGLSRPIASHIHNNSQRVVDRGLQTPALAELRPLHRKDKDTIAHGMLQASIF